MRQQLSKHWKLIGGAALAIGLAIQLVPVPGESVKAASTETGAARELLMPDPVRSVFEKACRDCHTNRTQWPWYGRVAPMSWALAHDVNRAREAANFSEWTAQAGRTPAKAIATLTAACANMRSGRMPLKGYQLLHPESRLSESEVNMFCEWTTQQTKALILAKRKVLAPGQP